MWRQCWQSQKTRLTTQSFEWHWLTWDNMVNHNFQQMCNWPWECTRPRRRLMHIMWQPPRDNSAVILTIAAISKSAITQLRWRSQKMRKSRRGQSVPDKLQKTMWRTRRARTKVRQSAVPTCTTSTTTREGNNAGDTRGREHLYRLADNVWAVYVQ